MKVNMCPECYYVALESDYRDGWRVNPPVQGVNPYCKHLFTNYKEIAPEQAETAMLFTIGYADHKPPLTPETFLATLQAQQVAFLVDIRRTPLSHKPGFSKSALSAFLEANSVGYWHCPALGASRELRRDLRATGDYDAFFLEFFGYLRSDKSAQAALRSVAALVADRQRLALLCTEADHERCHRQVVAEEVHRLLAAKPGLKHL